MASVKSSTISGPLTATDNDFLPFSNSHRYSPASPCRKFMQRCRKRSRGEFGLPRRSSTNVDSPPPTSMIDSWRPGASRPISSSEVSKGAKPSLWGRHCGDTCVAFAAYCCRARLVRWPHGSSTSGVQPISATLSTRPITLDCWRSSWGAACFLPTLIVPLLLITHGLSFRILLQHQPEHVMQGRRPLAQGR